MKCPYRKIKSHRINKVNGYTVDEEEFGNCYGHECPFYFAIERKEPVVVHVELCRIAEKMMDKSY